MIDCARESCNWKWMGEVGTPCKIWPVSRFVWLWRAGINSEWISSRYMCSHLNDDWTRLRLIFTSSLICLFSGFRSNIWTHESTVVISVWSEDEWKTVQKTNVSNPSWWTDELAAATYRATAASCAWWWFSSFFCQKIFSLRLEVSETMNEVT